MRSLLTGLLVSFLLTNPSFGQRPTVLSPKGQESLLSIYRSPQSPDQTLTDDLKSSAIELEYLHLYGLFISYQANEQRSVFDSFNGQLTRFEHSYQADARFPLMISTLLIQQCLLHWGNENYSDGIRSFYKAHRHFEKADSSVFRQDYLKLKGLFEIFLSQIPEQYQFWASLLGWQGNAEHGLQILKESLTPEQVESGSQHELLILYSYCLLKFGNADKSEINQLIQSAHRQPSPILAFIITSICIKKQMGDKGLSYLATIPNQFYRDFPLLYYAKGRMLLNKLDDGSYEQLSTFRTAFKGHSFQTDALLRQAWWFHLHPSHTKRDSLLSKIEQQKNLPTSNDKQALNEIQSLKTEPVALLNARLLFDGGYFLQARQALKQENIKTFNNYYLAEYYYRNGKIQLQLYNYQDALLNFDNVISLTSDDKRYIGPYAALEAARIHLHVFNDTTACRLYLSKAEKLNNGAYKTSISHSISSMLSK